jgi:hypothetical protein
LDRYFDLLSPESEKRELFKGDREKITGAIRIWRSHVKQTLGLPKMLQLKPVKIPSRSRLSHFYALLLNRSTASKAEQKGELLNGRYLIFSYSHGRKKYLIGCFRSNGKWGLLNDPFSLEAPQKARPDGVRRVGMTMMTGVPRRGREGILEVAAVYLRASVNRLMEQRLSCSCR